MTTLEKIESKDQLNKFIKKLKQYVLREFHNTEDIIALVRHMKNPMKILSTSRPTALSTNDGENPILVMIKT